ncbi:hypothetical protein ACME83_19245 [Enterobacter hormaechei]|uniref:hypothetical protein n=1 Tax=Enterobacter TaxID=547 RepID=UPI0011131C4F|nr:MULTISPECIES: hypothetical protein [Enterobacter]QLA00914.1 hypothetical protein HWQ15_01850 [Enterobacter sp. DSM 30060]
MTTMIPKINPPASPLAGSDADIKTTPIKHIMKLNLTIDHLPAALTINTVIRLWPGAVDQLDYCAATSLNFSNF